METPSDLFYTKEHEWIKFLNKTSAYVGITQYAVEQLGDIVHIELPALNETFTHGSAFGTVESTKTVSDLYMPVSGKVLEINSSILKSPENLQDDPYDSGWLVKIECEQTKDELMTADEYETYLTEQEE